MSEPRRFFVKEVSPVTEICGDEFKHATQVLRITVGESVILLDNTGCEYFGVVDSVSKKSFTVKITDKKLSDKECQTSVTLICGYLKGDKTEYAVQKAVELGVKKIVVFSSEFSSAYMNDNKLERLNRVSIESAKQCGRAVYPEVIYASDFKSALSYGGECQNKIFACEFADKNAIDFTSLCGSTAIVIGSEGGFSKQEAALAQECGYKTLWLGKRILRADTACVAVTALVMNALGELG